MFKFLFISDLYVATQKCSAVRPEIRLYISSKTKQRAQSHKTRTVTIYKQEIVPSIHKISYQLPPEIQRVHMPPCCSGGFEQGVETVEVMGTALRPVCHQALMGEMMTEAIETNFSGALTKNTHHNVITRKHFSKE